MNGERVVLYVVDCGLVLGQTGDWRLEAGDWWKP